LGLAAPPASVVGRCEVRLAAESVARLRAVAEVGDSVRAGDEVAALDDTFSTPAGG